jgi:hypothetical protein
MKTTLELPDRSFRKAKALAASQGITLKAFFTDALEEKLLRASQSEKQDAQWMEGFGKLGDLSDETREIMGVIEEEFETIDPDEIA